MSNIRVTTFNKLNESRERLGGLTAQMGALKPEQRAQLEHVLRMGDVSTEDMAEAKSIIKNTKAALDKFFAMSGFDPQFRGFVLKTIGFDIIARKDGGNPEKAVKDLEALAQAHANLLEHPT